jgi:hypothetical protein
MTLTHIRNTILEQTSWPIGTFVYGDKVTLLVKLVRSGESSRSRTDDGDFATRPRVRGLRNDPTFLPSTVNNGALDALDADGLFIDAEDAGALTRGGTGFEGLLA